MRIINKVLKKFNQDYKNPRDRLQNQDITTVNMNGGFMNQVVPLELNCHLLSFVVLFVNSSETFSKLLCSSSERNSEPGMITYPLFLILMTVLILKL